jgi:outer membrane receptor protein involved in Fe transport
VYAVERCGKSHQDDNCRFAPQVHLPSVPQPQWRFHGFFVTMAQLHLATPLVRMYGSFFRRGRENFPWRRHFPVTSSDEVSFACRAFGSPSDHRMRGGDLAWQHDGNKKRLMVRNRFSPRHRATLVAFAAIVAAVPAPLARAAENPTDAVQLPTIEVVGTTPLPGLGVPLKDVPANVQIYTSKDLARQRQSNLAEFLEQNPTSVTVNSAQGNPFQPDISFRGFTASPLLGLPQGLSVFQDGVRINEPFGDVVNWDLIPQSAVSSMQLLPGSIPAFGLNTLGGALAIYTKRGSDYPGGAIQAYGGSFGRSAVEFEQGGKRDHWDYFLTGNYFDDNGWAQHNPSRVKQFFGNVGYQTDKTDLVLSLTAADNTLQGTQTLPLSFFDDIRQAYTFPDININKLTFLTLKGSQALGGNVLMGGNAYYRKYKNESVSSNVNDSFGELDPDTGEIGTVQATNDRSGIDQDSYGFGLQFTLTGDVARMRNQFVIGATGDFGRARFTQDSQDAEFTADRAAVAIGDFTRVTDAKTMNRYYGMFIADTLSLNGQWTLTVSGRYNRAWVKIEDETGAAPLLNGEHTYDRFNPAAGINFHPNEQFTGYVSYNEGLRAPTPIELTCADPDAPCKLPNNFLADPPLKAVVSRTVEAGARGKWGDSSMWSAAVYRTELDDDIQFISSGGSTVNAGFFQNVGKTRRQGVELAAGTKWGALGASLRYSYIDATFQSAFAENSPSNSTADENGTIQVSPGNRIPAIPPHSAKLRLDYDIDSRWSIGGNVVYSGSAYARGDENNQDIGGKVPGYTVVNLDTRYNLAKGLELFARVNNLFDKRYANFGILGENFFNGPNRTFDPDSVTMEQFRGVGAPRGAWVGVRYAWL